MTMTFFLLFVVCATTFLFYATKIVTSPSKRKKLFAALHTLRIFPRNTFLLNLPYAYTGNLGSILKLWKSVLVRLDAKMLVLEITQILNLDMEVIMLMGKICSNTQCVFIVVMFCLILALSRCVLVPYLDRNVC